jgi:hypothetical protein
MEIKIFFERSCGPNSTAYENVRDVQVTIGNQTFTVLELLTKVALAK